VLGATFSEAHNLTPSFEEINNIFISENVVDADDDAA
jgi:hypothetical protein